MAEDTSRGKSGMEPAEGSRETVMNSEQGRREDVERERGAGHITNRPESEEAENQAAVPPRGERGSQRTD